MNTTTKPRKATSPPAAETGTPHAPRIHQTWSCGDKAHQGDLILVALAALPSSARERKNRQMADGNSPGSRHIVEGGEVFDASRTELATALKRDAGMDVDEKYIGPVFSGPCTLTHPKHAHQVFPSNPATVVVYQRNLDAEEREVRTRD